MTRWPLLVSTQRAPAEGGCRVAPQELLQLPGREILVGAELRPLGPLGLHGGVHVLLLGGVEGVALEFLAVALPVSSASRSRALASSSSACF
eukprot:8423103-Pyramimonas_sp.AAC.1